jgi:hypothetical protein
MSACEADGQLTTSSSGYSCDYSQSEDEQVQRLRGDASRAEAPIDWCGQGDNPCDKNARCISQSNGYQCIYPGDDEPISIEPTSTEETSTEQSALFVMPDIAMPDVSIPDVSMPDVSMPDISVPWREYAPLVLLWIIAVLVLAFVIVLACVGAIAFFSRFRSGRSHR